MRGLLRLLRWLPLVERAVEAGARVWRAVRGGPAPSQEAIDRRAQARLQELADEPTPIESPSARRRSERPPRD